MKYWPGPNRYSKNIPTNGFSGSFWEDRDDRRHCGIDIYAPKGSGVIAIEYGKVIDIGLGVVAPIKMALSRIFIFLIFCSNRHSSSDTKCLRSNF